MVTTSTSPSIPARPLRPLCPWRGPLGTPTDAIAQALEQVPGETDDWEGARVTRPGEVMKLDPSVLAPPKTPAQQAAQRAHALACSEQLLPGEHAVLLSREYGVNLIPRYPGRVDRLVFLYRPGVDDDALLAWYATRAIPTMSVGVAIPGLPTWSEIQAHVHYARGGPLERIEDNVPLAWRLWTGPAHGLARGEDPDVEYMLRLYQREALDRDERDGRLCSAAAARWRARLWDLRHPLQRDFEVRTHGRARGRTLAEGFVLHVDAHSKDDFTAWLRTQHDHAQAQPSFAH